VEEMRRGASVRILVRETGAMARYKLFEIEYVCVVVLRCLSLLLEVVCWNLKHLYMFL